MSLLQSVLIYVGIVFVITAMAGELEGQLEEMQSVNVTETLLDLYPFVSVEYETGSMIVIKGDEDSLLLLNGTLAPFWEAIDEAEKVGYVLEDVTSSGMGSQGNPTRFYAVMGK